MNAEGAYPLQWLPGYPRAKRRARSRFGRAGAGVSFAEARDGLIDELRLLGASDVVLSTNIELRLDGLPYANRRSVEDTGVSVFFTFKGDRRVICCDRYDTRRRQCPRYPAHHQRHTRHGPLGVFAP